MSSELQNIPYHIDELHFGSSTLQPFLSLSRLPYNTLSDSARKINPNTTSVARLAPLLQALPDTLISRENAANSYMKVVINGPLAVAKDGSGMLPWTSKNGKIGEVARLLEPENISNLINSAMLFQIASAVVAQKHLADISQKLDQIQQGIDRIESFQKDKRASEINGIISYFNQISTPVLQGELTESVRNTLEIYEKDLISLIVHLNMELEREVEQIKNSASTHSKNQYEFIQKNQSTIKELLDQIILCTRTRAAGWQLLSAFPGELKLKQSRQSAIQASIDKFSDHGGILSDIDHCMKHNVAALHSRWETQVSLNKKKSELWKSTEEYLISTKSNAKAIRDELFQGTAMLLDFQKPVILAMKIKYGEIVEAYQITD